MAASDDPRGQPPPLPPGFAPAPIPVRIGRALASGWEALGWKGKLLVVCGAYLAVNLLVVAFAGLGSHADHARRNLETLGDATDRVVPPPQLSHDDGGKRLATAEVAGVSVAPQRNDREDEHMTKGSEALRKSDWDLAILEFTAAIQRNPRNARAYSQRGEAYYWNRSAQSAIADCTTAIALNPRDTRAYVTRAAVYVNQKRFAQAMASLDEAVRITPGDAFLYAARGAIYANQKFFEQAMANFDEAVRIAPGNGSLRFRRARCALAWGIESAHEAKEWHGGRLTGCSAGGSTIAKRPFDSTRRWFWWKSMPTRCD